jgi:methionine synthase II (cobalamin-independent)
MATSFRADNIGSLLRPAELIDARTAHFEKRLSSERSREVEDRAILRALELQKSAGVVCRVMTRTAANAVAIRVPGLTTLKNQLSILTIFL